jgi:hypothetical protein
LSVNRNLIIALLSLAAVSAATYGAWKAWSSGIIGSSARAPVASAMEAAVRGQARIDLARHNRDYACVGLDLSQPPPEVTGFAGIAHRIVPGQFAITLLEQASDRYQPARKAQIAQLDFLAAQGLLTRDDIQVGTDAGARPARSYGLTWDGYLAIKSSGRSSLCLAYGHREFDGIETIEKLPEMVMGLEVYDVTYRTRVHDVPAWATAAEGAQLFSELPKLIAEQDDHAKLIRTQAGWQSSYKMELEAAMTASGKQGALAVQAITRMLATKAPAQDEILKIVGEKIEDPSWLARNGVACLPLSLAKGGDDKQAQRERDGAFTVTYFDRPDRNKYELAAMATSLQVLSALESAGLAELQYLDPVSAPTPEPGGVRYRVSDQATDTLELRGRNGCVPAGTISVEVLATQAAFGQIVVTGRATVAETPEWVLGLADKLPALRSLIEVGMPMVGRLRVDTEADGAISWLSAGMEPVYPGISYSRPPPHLMPVMPATFALLEGKAVEAPEFRSPGVEITRPLLPTRAPAKPPEPGPPPPAVAVPYPAGNSPVHVISIYEAPLPGGGARSGGDHPDGVASVVVSDPDATLLLLSYEPIEWRIRATRGVEIGRIVAIGNYEPRVKLTGGGKPDVIAGTRSRLLKSTDIDERNGFPTQSGSNNLVDIGKITRALTGTLPRSYQGIYKAPEDGFNVGEQTPVFELPQALAPGTVNGVVELKGETVHGDLVLRGSGNGAMAFADRAYSAGKVYFEGTMRVTGSVAAHGRANIGLCLIRGAGIDQFSPGNVEAIGSNEQRLHSDGDVFGMAVDFDHSRLFTRVNGVWTDGEPGSGGGLAFASEKAYRACFQAFGVTESELPQGTASSETTWQVNFGGRPFESPMPPGYVAYQ